MLINEDFDVMKVDTDRFLRFEKERNIIWTESTLTILNDEMEIVFRDRLENFVLLWDEIKKKDGDEHLSILIDYRTLGRNDHFQYSVFKSELSEKEYELAVEFIEKVCPKLESRRQKNLWKAIRYEMPEKPTSKRTTYKKWCMKARVHHYSGSKNKL